MENTIKTIQGPEIKISWNMIDCPCRSNCEDREEREKKPCLCTVVDLIQVCLNVKHIKLKISPLEQALIML